MAYTRLTQDLNIIAALDDEPNDVGGMSAAQLKASYDAAGLAIKNYLNTVLLQELEANTAAGNLGCNVSGVTGTTVAAAIADLKRQLDAAAFEMVLGTNSINDPRMLLNSVVTSEKVNFNYAGAETKGGAANSVGHALTFADGTTWNGSADKTLDASIFDALPANTRYAASSSIGGAANRVAQKVTFNDGGLGAEPGTEYQGNVARTVSYNTVGAQKRQRCVAVTLWSGATTWNIAVTGLKAGNPTDQTVDWGAMTDAGYTAVQNCNIRAVNPNPTAGMIQFKADSAPSANIQIMLRIFED